MRLMDRNKRDMWLSRATGRTEILDAEGFGTAEYRTSYSEPVRFRGNWAPPTGLATWAPFGTQVSYDVAVVLDDNDLGIREGDVVWLGRRPGTVPGTGSRDATFSQVRTAWSAQGDQTFESAEAGGEPDRTGAYVVTRVASLWNAFAFALKSMGGQ